MTNMQLLFAKYDLSAIFQNQEQKAIQAVDAYNANQLLNTSVDELILYFVTEYRIEHIELAEGQISVDQKEVKVDISQDRSRFIHDRSGPYYVDGTQFTYFVPYTGDNNLFYCRPSTFTFNPPRAVVKSGEIHFVYDILDQNIESIKSAFSSELSSVKQYVTWIKNDVQSFNTRLEQSVRQRVEWRRQKILNDQGMASSLGFPLRKRENAPMTFSVPLTRKKVNIPPAASVTPFEPEPALSMEMYEQILNIMLNMVLVMERSPNAFRDMKEEDLRQHFLVQLNGQFEGQATAETFNFQGKTDILLRSGGKNVFIAECKFWKGSKVFSETIDQLLGYLSWRDTKAAILVFNRTKNFSEVVRTLPEIVREHPNFIKELPMTQETITRYILRQNQDSNREFILSVLAFNIPIITKNE
jgi:hypothetical protein